MTRNETFRQTFADLARPFAIWASSASASLATVRLAWTAYDGKVDLNGAAIYMTAIWAGVGALYIGKAWEKNTEAKQNAQVAIEQAKANSPSATGVVPASSDEGDDGELPETERVRS